MSKHVILGVLTASLAAGTAFAQTSVAAASVTAPMTATIPTPPKAVTAPLADNAVQPTAPATTPAPAVQPDKSAAGADTNGTMNSNTSAATTTAMTEQVGSWSATRLIGKNVKNRANETIGAVDDLIINSDGKVSAVVIGVGGFLGMGERRVAVPFDKLQVAGLVSGTADFAVMDMTKDALKAAPEYKPVTQQPSN